MRKFITRVAAALTAASVAFSPLVARAPTAISVRNLISPRRNPSKPNDQTSERSRSTGWLLSHYYSSTTRKMRSAETLCNVCSEPEGQRIVTVSSVSRSPSPQ